MEKDTKRELDKLDKEITYNFGYEDLFAEEDLKNRCLFINDIIDSEMAYSAIYHIIRYNREDKGLSPEERKPIKIFINTCGGEVASGFGIIDAILQSKTKVYTVNMAACYSMGFLIFLAGDKRYTFAHSTFLCHDGSSFAYDSTAKLKDRVEFETGDMEKQTKDYILSRTSITPSLYKKKYRNEWYMYPEEAKKYEIVTDIIGEDGCSLDEVI